jgi:hypothetical protein
MTPPLAHCHLFTSGFYSERRIWFNALGPRFLTEARKLNSWNSFIDFLENYDSIQDLWTWRLWYPHGSPNGFQVGPDVLVSYGLRVMGLGLWVWCYDEEVGGIGTHVRTFRDKNQNLSGMIPESTF